jgi:uncharacterized membrane protein SirB2
VLTVLEYANLKAIHVGFVVASATLFFVRGILMMTRPAALKTPWARIVPHVIDTMLLAAAIGMLVVARINPLNSSWLTAKLIALIVYIALGTIALKRGRSRTVRWVAWLLALFVLTYIAGVAFAKRPWPF